MMTNTAQSGEDRTQLYTWKEPHLGCGGGWEVQKALR